MSGGARNKVSLKTVVEINGLIDLNGTHMCCVEHIFVYRKNHSVPLIHYTETYFYFEFI